MASLKVLQSSFGHPFFNTWMMQRTVHAMLPLPTWANLPQHIPHDISHNFTLASMTRTPQRATVVSAIRHTLAESSPSYDELLASLIMDFLDLIHHKDLVCRLILKFPDTNSSERPPPCVVRSKLCGKHETPPHTRSPSNFTPEHLCGDESQTRSLSYSPNGTLDAQSRLWSGCA
jgi:hypothetical protein